MSLKWSDPRPGDGKVSSYDHVIAETPLGRILIEWKGWKEYDIRAATLPWGETVLGSDLAAAKSAVQSEWDAKIEECEKLKS